jgi:pimeloyl-ACP methyl ester carboxylesterase
MTPTGVERLFVPLAHGTVHCAVAGSGRPVLLLHQTPRSWDEYRDVLPILARAGYRAIAMDTPGFGDSPGLDYSDDSIEAWAEVAVGLADALELDRAAIVGHHTGAVIALEIAAA